MASRKDSPTPNWCAWRWPRKNRTRFQEFCRYLRPLYSPDVQIAIVCDNFSPHLTTATDGRVGAQANNVEITYTQPTPPG